MPISHLQFADDTIFFFESDDSSFKNLSVVLETLFCSASRLKINMSKSTILGVGVDDALV